MRSCNTATAENLSSEGGFCTKSFNTDSSKVDSGKAISCVKAAVRGFAGQFGKFEVRVGYTSMSKEKPHE